MNLSAAILQMHSKKQALSIADFGIKNKKNFQSLMDCFLSDNQPLAQKAAWSVGCATKKNHEFIIPYIKDLVNLLRKNNLHPAIVRNTVMILERIPIPKVYEGTVMHACFTLVASPQTAPAIKAYSLTILFHLSLKYPEIRSESQQVIENQWDDASPAFKSRGKRILGSIKKQQPIKN